jgi:hypothetical protein
MVLISLIVILFTALFIFMISQFSVILIYGTNYIRNEGIKMLEKELEYYHYNHITEDINLSKNSELEGRYITKYSNYIIYPYVLIGGDKRYHYPILKYTKAYYLVKEVFDKESGKNINKRIKF